MSAAQTPGGSQLRSRVEDTGGDQGEGPFALGRGNRGDGAVEAQLAQSAQHGGDMAMGRGTGDVEGVVAADEGFVPEQPAQRLDFRGGPGRQVGQGAFAHALAFTPALAQQNGRGRVAIGDGFDVHGNYYMMIVHNKQYHIYYYMGTSDHPHNAVGGLKSIA